MSCLSGCLHGNISAKCPICISMVKELEGKQFATFDSQAEQIFALQSQVTSLEKKLEMAISCLKFHATPLAKITLKKIEDVPNAQ